MNLSAPTKAIFIIAVIIALLAIIGMFVAIPFVSANGFWVMTAAFVLLAAGNVMSGV